MFEKIIGFFKTLSKKEQQESPSKDTAKERLHLVLMQDRANVSADFLELMKQEIIEVIKKYVDVDEKSIDVRLTNKSNDDGSNGAPALYANIPIVNVRNDMKKDVIKDNDTSAYSKEEQVLPNEAKEIEQNEEKIIEEKNENVEIKQDNEIQPVQEKTEEIIQEVVKENDIQTQNEVAQEETIEEQQIEGTKNENENQNMQKDDSEITENSDTKNEEHEQKFHQVTPRKNEQIPHHNNNEYNSSKKKNRKKNRKK